MSGACRRQKSMPSRRSWASAPANMTCVDSTRPVRISSAVRLVMTVTP
jgi:hypothetical protein